MNNSSLITIVVVVFMLIAGALIERRDARNFEQRLEAAKIEFNVKQLNESVKFREFQEKQKAGSK